MEGKLSDLMDDGDYYSAHQLILSLTKRKVKIGKINEAVEFVKNGVTRLCQANQFASASDAAMSIFEYATKSNFSDMKEMFSQLLNSTEAQYWRTFLNEMGKAELLDDSDIKFEIFNLIFDSNPSGNSDKLSAMANIILQLSNERRQNSLQKFATCLISKKENVEMNNIHVYFISELSLNLTKECQFFDNEYFLKCISSSVNGQNFDENDGIIPVEAQEFKLVNFCILVNYLCQRKSPPKALFLEILNEYLPESVCKIRSDLARLRSFSESSLADIFWPAPKSRYGSGAGGPSDLMNMLQGLLGPQMRN